jgi:hypothetical protein
VFLPKLHATKVQRQEQEELKPKVSSMFSFYDNFDAFERALDPKKILVLVVAIQDLRIVRNMALASDNCQRLDFAKVVGKEKQRVVGLNCSIKI